MSTERKVFTYRDAEEAKKYIGKRGRFGDNLGHLQLTIHKGGYHEGVLTEAEGDNIAFPFEFEGCARRCQFFSPDPEPVERWVPFTDEDGYSIIGRVVRRKSWLKSTSARGACTMLVHVNLRGATTGNCIDVPFEELFLAWEFIDGTPCGKKVTE